MKDLEFQQKRLQIALAKAKDATRTLITVAEKLGASELDIARMKKQLKDMEK